MVHGVLRRTDDLVVDGEGGRVGSGVVWPRVPLKENLFFHSLHLINLQY